MSFFMKKNNAKIDFYNILGLKVFDQMQAS